MEYVTLRNGMSVSAVGLGTHPMRPHQLLRVIPYLSSTGINLVDTAHDYKNEKWIGITKNIKGKQSLVISTKMSVGQQRERYRAGNAEITKQAFKESIRKLGVKKLGMFLLHFPYPASYIDCWHDMEELYKEGLVECIGVCNCQVHHLQRIIEESEIIPFVNQVECHPYLAQNELLEFCNEHEIKMEAYSPFARSLPDMIYNPVLTEIAKEHGKSVYQVILRWDYQRGVIPLPKASSIEKVRNNADIFDFNLDDREMEMINSLDRGFRIRYNPDTVDYEKL